MSTKPILFSTPMVQAILDGRKTMTRRVIKPQPMIMANGKPLNGYNDSMIKAAGEFPTPKYQPGDVLWVRETCFCWVMPMGERVYRYRATDPDGNKAPSGPEYDDELVIMPWTPSIYMPKEAARIFLRVTDVRVEKLQDISLKDIEREGLYCDSEYSDPTRIGHFAYEPGMRIHFTKLWDSIYAKRGYGWDTNPWVWVYSFERVDKPAGWPGGEGGE